MRVAFITHYTALYGANRSMINLIDGMIPLGVEPFVIVPGKGGITSALQKRGIPFLAVPHQKWSGIVASGEGNYEKVLYYIRWRKDAFLRLRKNFSIITSVIRRLKEWKIDIIYTNSSVIPLGAMAAWLMKKPHVWHLREFGDLDYNLTPDWGKVISDFVLRRASAQICISKAIRSHYDRGLVRDKCYVVYNGVLRKTEMDRLHREAVPRRIDSDGFVFSIVGLIHQGKGQETAIKALALLKEAFPGVRLLIAGGGDVEPLEALAKSCGVLQQVTFCGYVENPYDIYLRSDAVLMCSKNEAMGRVSVEAMAAGKPVIGYDGGGTSELIIHEFNGLLYKGEEKELAASMRRLAENPEWAGGMGENGWQTARDRYSIEACAGDIYEILAGILAQKAVNIKD